MNNTNFKLQVWFPILFSLVMIAGMVVGYKLRENSGIKNFFSTGNHSNFQEVFDLVQLRYVDNIKTDSLTNEAINNFLHKLDPHSVYIPATDLDFVNDDLRGNFSGIGIEFQIFTDTVNVLNVVPDGPSEKAGLQLGDKILRINDSITIAGKGLNANEIRRILRGEKGSNVKLTILRDNKIINANIIRGNIPVPTVDAAYMLDKEIGFIRLNKFGENTFKEFMQAMEKLTKQGISKLILDLRGNGGGLLDQAINIADEFLDEDKLVVYTEGAHIQKSEYRCKRPGIFENGKLVLLVDEGSASASEVLSGALQDWDRATIIGRRTFGKGLVQEQFNLTDGSALRLTVARYFTPLGRNIQKPFSEGYEKYEDEINNRLLSGATLNDRDTNQQNHKLFTTKKGKKVYDGGGITPDFFVSVDTTAMSPAILKLYTKETLNNFVYNYYINNKSEFNKYETIEEFVQQYKSGDTEWEALKTFAKNNQIDLSGISLNDKLSILQKLPRMLARQKWRSEGYFKALNKTDEFVLKAIEELEKK